MTSEGQFEQSGDGHKGFCHSHAVGAEDLQQLQQEGDKGAFMIHDRLVDADFTDQDPDGADT